MDSTLAGMMRFPFSGSGWGRARTGPGRLAVGVFDELGSDVPGLLGCQADDDFVEAVLFSGVDHEPDRAAITGIKDRDDYPAMDDQSRGRLGHGMRGVTCGFVHVISLFLQQGMAGMPATWLRAWMDRIADGELPGYIRPALGRYRPGRFTGRRGQAAG
jgi:hypothetical protein